MGVPSADTDGKLVRRNTFSGVPGFTRKQFHVFNCAKTGTTEEKKIFRSTGFHKQKQFATGYKKWM